MTSIIDLAGRLGVTVVAEGVENQATADLLRRSGCQIAQGYHYARPMPFEAVNAWMATNRPDLRTPSATPLRPPVPSALP